MKTLPSKELLSEVLNIEVKDYGFSTHDKSVMYLNQMYWIDDDGQKHRSGCEKSISIYELAHKCKEWAISKGYHIESMLYDENVDRKYTSGLAKVLFSDANSNYNEVFSCDESTEPEAIFKACEWIKEQIK